VFNTIRICPTPSIHQIAPSRELRRTTPQAFALIVSLLLLVALLHSPTAQAEILLSLKTEEQTLDLTREQLEALPQQRVLTSTAWTDGVKDFQGPLMRDVLALLVKPIAEGAVLRLIALNEYEVSVSVDDYRQWDVVLAHHMDGKPLTRLDKGPLWVVYPRDQNPELQDSRVDHRWAWMLRTIATSH
jgi:hypothetical protein